jgi:hypothetical protein
MMGTHQARCVASPVVFAVLDEIQALPVNYLMTLPLASTSTATLRPPVLTSTS